jgi:hypothetical protein
MKNKTFHTFGTFPNSKIIIVERSKINIYILMHGHFHIGLVINPRPILALDCVQGQYGGLGMITRPIWKCPCIKLFIT